MAEEVGRRTKALLIQVLEVSQATVRVLSLLRPDNIDIPLIKIAELVALEVVVELHIPFHCRSCKSPAIGVRALGRAAGRLVPTLFSRYSKSSRYSKGSRIKRISSFMCSKEDLTINVVRVFEAVYFTPLLWKMDSNCLAFLALSIFSITLYSRHARTRRAKSWDGLTLSTDKVHGIWQILPFRSRSILSSFRLLQ